MGSYSEIEDLFREVLAEKDRFRISAAATQICEKLEKSYFKEECKELKERQIDATYNLLCIYSISFNEIMRERLQRQMGDVLKCIDISEN